MIQLASLAKKPVRPADDAPHLLVVDDDRRIRDLDGQKLMPMPDLSRFDATFKPIAES